MSFKGLLVSQKMSAQSILVHLRIIKALLTYAIKYPDSKDSRILGTYFDSMNSILEKVGTFIGIIELWWDSRLHLCLLSYPSGMTPNLLVEAISSEILRRKAKR